MHIFFSRFPRTMNNFADLNMVNIGFMQFLLEAEQEYNAIVEKERRRKRQDHVG